MKNCNDYERIRKKLEEERKKYKFCYIQGPTGPKGEKGDIGPKEIEVYQDQLVLILELQKQ